LENKRKILEVLVEELAHHEGADGSIQHKLKLHDIYSKIISGTMKWK
jgi:hypothetical protein